MAFWWERLGLIWLRMLTYIIENLLYRAGMRVALPSLPFADVLVIAFYFVSRFPLVGDGFVELSFGRRELVRNRVCDSFRKKRGGIKLEQALLDHPPH